MDWTGWQGRADPLLPVTVEAFCAETVVTLWLHERAQGGAGSLDNLCERLQMLGAPWLPTVGQCSRIMLTVQTLQILCVVHIAACMSTALTGGYHVGSDHIGGEKARV